MYLPIVFSPPMYASLRSFKRWSTAMYFLFRLGGCDPDQVGQLQYQLGLALLWWYQPVDRCWDVVDRWLHWTSCATPPSDYLFCFHPAQRHSTLQEKPAHHPTRCSQSSSEDYPTEGVCWASVASVQHSRLRSPTLVRMPEPSVGGWRIEVHCCWYTRPLAHDFGQLSILPVRCAYIKKFPDTLKNLLICNS